MNLVSMAMNYLGPAIAAKIASSLGIKSSVAQMAIAAIVPSLLAGITGKASQPGGAGVLADLLGKQDGSLLASLGDLIGSDRQATVADQGLGNLGTLLGNAGLGALTGAIGEFTGTDKSASSSLLGLAAPAILGMLGQQQREQGLDAGGLASMLAGQKDNIAQAMPAGFADLLKGSGLIDSIAPNLAALAPAAAPPTPRHEEVLHAQPAATTGGSMGWLPWAAGIAVAALAGWYFLGSGGTRTAAVPEAPKIMLGDKNVGRQFGNAMTSLHGALGGIKDAASAKATLPKLKAAQGSINRVEGLASQLTGDAKSSFQGYAAKWLPVVLPMLAKLADDPTIGPVIKPFIGPITDRLKAMAA